MKKQTLLLSIAAIYILASCSPTQQEKQEETYQVINPFVADTVYTNEYVAEINAQQNVEVRTRIKGFIETIFVDEGQRVHKGQTLFSISSEGYRQELLKAQAITKSALAEQKYAEIELENTKKLFDKNIIAKPEYDLAGAKVDALKAKVEEVQSEEAQANLKFSFTEIKAPFDGTINRIPNKTGSLIEEGALLTTISNSKNVYAYFNVSEKEYLDLITENNDEPNTGKDNKETVLLVLANGDIYEHEGVIETSESEFDKSTGNIAFRAKFPNPDGLLKHGSNGKIVVEKSVKKAVIIPQKSTFEIQDKLYVYVLKKDSTIEQRNIISNIRLPHIFIIESGLQNNEHILYEGVQSVRDGSKIIPDYIIYEQSGNSTL